MPQLLRLWGFSRKGRAGYSCGMSQLQVRMPRMKAIDPRKANGAVRAVFDDIKATRKVKQVNNFWKYLANEPRMLKHTWESLKSIMGPGHLDPLTKELVYVAVSVTNNCDYCMASHTAAARAKGASEAQINELYAVIALANMTNRLANAYRVPVDEQFKTE
jgi:AhpD family alkylhydroperoxidase